MTTTGVANVVLLEDINEVMKIGKKKGNYETSAKFFIEYWWWNLRFYPVGLDDVNIKQDYSAIGLERLDGYGDDLTVWCSWVLMKVGKAIREGNRYCRFINESIKCHNFDLVEQDVLQSREMSLQVTISIRSYSLEEKSRLRLKSVSRSLKKEVCLVSGKTSVTVNAALLGFSSPVLKAKLDSGQPLLGPHENTIDLGEGGEKYLQDLVDFLEGKEIDLNVTNNYNFEKFRILATFGDMWKIESVLDFIFIKLTTSPRKEDLVRRLLLLTRFKHIPKFHQGSKTLTLWAYKNMSQKEFMDLTTKVFLSNIAL